LFSETSFLFLWWFLEMIRIVSKQLSKHWGPSWI
jgi:hypothetical protein